MPERLATSMTSMPAGASTSFPSIVSLIGSGIGGARPPIQMRFEFVAEFLDDGNRRHRCGVAERTEGPAQHVLRQIADQVDVAARPHPLMEADEQLAQPSRALATGDAPAAALVRVEPHDAQ